MVRVTLVPQSGATTATTVRGNLAPCIMHCTMTSCTPAAALMHPPHPDDPTPDTDNCLRDAGHSRVQGSWSCAPLGSIVLAFHSTRSVVSAPPRAGRVGRLHLLCASHGARNGCGTLPLLANPCVRTCGHVGQGLTRVDRRTLVLYNNAMAQLNSSFITLSTLHKFTPPLSTPR